MTMLPGAVRGALFLSLTSLGCSPALAGEPLEETVVTATRTPLPLDLVGVPVIVIGRDEIERSMASDVSEILRRHAGLEISRNGGPGQTTSLFLRGADSNHSVVLVDGVRVNPGTLGAAAIQNISPESLDRIEIVKGPRSALYGTDAIGGVVQLFTRRGERDSVGAGSNFGSNSTYQFFGDATLVVNERAKFGFGASVSESDGIPTFLDDEHERGYRNTTARGNAEFTLSEALALRVHGWHSSGRTEYTEPDFFSAPIAYAPVSQDYENSVYALESEYRATNGLRLRGSLGRVQDLIEQNQLNVFSGAPDYARTSRNTLDLQLDLPTLHGHSLTFGAQRSDENTAALSFGTLFDIDTVVTQLFVQDQFRLGRVTGLLALGHVEHDTFGRQLTWNAELGTAIGSGTRVALLGGSAFRAPDSTDRFGFGGNPELDPEQSRQIELRVRQKIGTRQSLTLSLFDNRIRELIEYVVSDPLTFDGRNENVERVRIRGAEFGYELRGSQWRLRADVVLQNPRDESQGQRLLRRARESVSASFERRFGKMDLEIDLQAHGARRDFGNTELGAYTLADIGLRYRLTNAFSVQGRVGNLFDERYALAAGYRTQARHFTVGMRYQFR
jgi:vitamin B12 transporter